MQFETYNKQINIFHIHNAHSIYGNRDDSLRAVSQHQSSSAVFKKPFPSALQLSRTILVNHRAGEQ